MAFIPLLFTPLTSFFLFSLLFQMRLHDSLLESPTHTLHFLAPLPLPWVHLVVPITVVYFQLQIHPSLLRFVILELGAADIISFSPATPAWALPIERAGGDSGLEEKEGAFSSSGAVSTPGHK